jgi:plastocyanin
MRGRVKTAVAATAAALTLLLSQAIPAQAAVLVKAGAGRTCMRFGPAKLSIARGTKVVWKATCGDHTVSSYGGNWSKNTSISQGETTSRIFRTKGVFKYRCKIHSTLFNGVCSGMCGKIVVGT